MPQMKPRSVFYRDIVASFLMSYSTSEIHLPFAPSSLPPNPVRRVAEKKRGHGTKRRTDVSLSPTRARKLHLSPRSVSTVINNSSITSALILLIEERSQRCGMTLPAAAAAAPPPFAVGGASSAAALALALTASPSPAASALNYPSSPRGDLSDALRLSDTFFFWVRRISRR